jgi:hypothetical protein
MYADDTGIATIRRAWKTIMQPAEKPHGVRKEIEGETT